MDSRVIAVAVSGGIDSLAAGLLIRQQTQQVFGIHFLTGYEPERTDIPSLEKQLGFKIFTVDLKEEFQQSVVDYFISTYLNGQTPNPCLICNYAIKFGSLLSHAQKLGADYLATGHYARVVNPVSFPGKNIPVPWLEKAADRHKDQSYFLSRLDTKVLNRILFPLAQWTKAQVRQMVEDKGLTPVHAKESQDICFIRQDNVSQFILEQTGISPKAGDIRDMDGRTVGRHQGLFSFTVGQRKGINCPAPQAYYVKQIDPGTNTLHVCFKPDLYRREMPVEQVIWNDPESPLPLSGMNLMTRIRYGHKEAPSALTVHKETDGSFSGHVVFDTPQGAITPGQAAVFYKGNRVLGSGIIK